MLESYIREKRKTKDILLMTHMVIGYPSFEACFDIVAQMVEAGVDMMELQIPFSEPVADGPVILKASQKALEKGLTVQKCLEFADAVVKSFPIPFLCMTYANIPFQYGIEQFAEKVLGIGLKGAIIPDLPPEEGEEYIRAMKNRGLDPVFIFTPETRKKRLLYLSSLASGFVYCTARKGVTGEKTRFSEDLSHYLSRCRKVTPLPLAVGFGVKEKADVQFLKGKADIAVIGSETIRVVEEKGIRAAGEFIRSIR